MMQIKSINKEKLKAAGFAETLKKANDLQTKIERIEPVLDSDRHSILYWQQVVRYEYKPSKDTQNKIVELLREELFLLKKELEDL